MAVAVILIHLIPGREVTAASTLPPPLETALRADLAARAAVDEAAIELMRVGAVTWRNSCLACNSTFSRDQHEEPSVQTADDLGTAVTPSQRRRVRAEPAE